MASRECDECSRRFGTGVGQLKCIWCGGTLSYNAGQAPTVEKEEYEAQMYVRGLKKLAELPDEELGMIERDWQAIELEVGRRGSRLWSEADIIAEAGFFSVRDAA